MIYKAVFDWPLAYQSLL